MSRGMSSSSFNSVSGDNPLRRRASACSTCVSVASVRAARSASAGGRGRGPSAARAASSIASSFSTSRSMRSMAACCEVRVAEPWSDASANTVSTLPPRSGGEGGRASADASPGGGSFGEAVEAPPTPDPSPPLASLAGGGEKPPLRGGRDGTASAARPRAASNAVASSSSRVAAGSPRSCSLRRFHPSSSRQRLIVRWLVA